MFKKPLSQHFPQNILSQDSDGHIGTMRITDRFCACGFFFPLCLNVSEPLRAARDNDSGLITVKCYWTSNKKYSPPPNNMILTPASIAANHKAFMQKWQVPLATGMPPCKMCVHNQEGLAPSRSALQPHTTVWIAPNCCIYVRLEEKHLPCLQKIN